MQGLSLGIAAPTRQKWWPSGAVYAADFINQRYMRDGNAITADQAMSFSRPSAKWALDSSGTWRQFAANQPALTDLGLSIEPAGTNLVPNPGLAGAVVGVVGAGGSLPTGWFHNSTLTTEVVAITTLLGLPALQVRISGVASTTFYELSVMPTGVAIAPSTTYTASIFVQLLSGTMPILQVRQAASGDAQVMGNSLGLGQGARWGGTFESHASAVQARIRFGIITAVGQSYSTEMLVACPQWESVGAATSPLFASRSADSLNLRLPSGPFAVLAKQPSGVTALPAGTDPYSFTTSLISPVVQETWAVPV